MKNFKYLLTACLAGASFVGGVAHAERDQADSRGKATAHKHPPHSGFVHMCLYDGSAYSIGSLIKAADTTLQCIDGSEQRIVTKKSEKLVLHSAQWVTPEEAKAIIAREEEAKLPVPEDDKKAKEEAKKSSK